MTAWRGRFGPNYDYRQAEKSVLDLSIPGAANHSMKITRVSFSEWQVYEDYASD
jgi:hypothetical protein